MHDLIDDMAISQRSAAAVSIWRHVRNTIRVKYAGVPYNMMSKKQEIALVENQRHGGQKS
jgi:hypothetical protein